MAFHRFKAGDREAWRWTHVVPGDLVVSTGTYAYCMRDFSGRDEDTRVLHLRQAPILVLARINGIPGEEAPGWHHTFVCLSRHGIVVVVQTA